MVKQSLQGQLVTIVKKISVFDKKQENAGFVTTIKQA